MESPSAASWLSSTRLYMITRVSAGYGWVNPRRCPRSALIIKQSLLLFFLLCSLSSIWHQSRRSNRPAQPRTHREKQHEVITHHVSRSLTENGGSVLRQHHRTAEDRAGVLPNGLLRQEVSFLPQGEARSIHSHLVEVEQRCSRPRQRPPSHDASLDLYFVLMTSQSEKKTKKPQKNIKPTLRGALWVILRRISGAGLVPELQPITWGQSTCFPQIFKSNYNKATHHIYSQSVNIT